MKAMFFWVRTKKYADSGHHMIRGKIQKSVCVKS